MQKLENLTKEELIETSHQIADAFWRYRYNSEDEGLTKYIRTKEDMFTYIDAIVQAAYKSGMLYTTSDKREGFLILSGEGVGSVKFIEGIKMILAEKKVLGGYKQMKEFISACFAEGNTIETRMRKAKRKFIRIEMLAVREEYQKQGYMKEMMDYVYKIADNRGLPVILDTDDKDKCLRYQHLGMTLDRIRNCGERFHMYDLIREPSKDH
ncbi:MAG: GNAT family N-acetyltransferase [Oscillospiraceae bacterium]|nr:GNAT family N-acetyltransferase [Oscillospiraceae bacterium]